MEQLRDLFVQTWKRPPSTEELRGLINEQVTEEIYVREALKLGLDRDDTVIRRRLRQKMEFLTDAEVGAISPTDAELESYLAAHPDAFSTPPRMAFQQVFFNPDRRGDVIERDSRVALASLIADPGAGTARFGDASLLPADMPLSSEREIAAVFRAGLRHGGHGNGNRPLVRTGRIGLRAALDPRHGANLGATAAALAGARRRAAGMDQRQATGAGGRPRGRAAGALPREH